MQFIVDCQCKYGCSSHAEGEWYQKYSSNNPWRAYLKLREWRIFNYASKYRMRVER